MDTVHQSCHQIIKSGIMPAIQKVFLPRPWEYPVQFQLWLDTIRFFIRHKLLELQYTTRGNTYLTITNIDSYSQLTFYPVGATAPTLHLCASTVQNLLTYGHSSYLARAATVESANEAKLR
jgi:hypothetical protein